MSVVGLFSTYTGTSSGTVSIELTAFYYCSNLQLYNLGSVYTNNSTGVVPTYFKGPGDPNQFNNVIFTSSPPLGLTVKYNPFSEDE